MTANNALRLDKYGYCKEIHQPSDFNVLDSFFCNDIGALLFCSQGGLKLSVNQTDTLINPGDLFTILPHTPISIVETSQEFTAHLIVFPISLIEGASIPENIFSLISCIKEQPILSLSADKIGLAEQYISLIKSLYSSINNEEYHVIQGVLSSFLYAVYLGYSRKTTPKFQEKYQRKHYLFKEFLNLVGKYYSVAHDLKFYADKLCITPKYLSSVCLEVSQKRPSYYINKAIIIDAKNKLKAGELNVSEVAYSLNFASLSFFGKFFKRNTGMAPTEFINK